MAKLTLTVSQAQEGRTVLSLLRGELGLSTARIGRLKRVDSGLTANGERVFTNARLRAGDFLAVDLAAAERPTDLLPIPMDLDIRYEDEHLLVLNKNAPLAVIPSSLVPGEPTLAGGLAAHLGPGFTFHPVNRLDRGTTGLMAVAKSGYIHDQLRRQMHGGGFQRRYLALCVGAPLPPAGQIDLPIARAPGSAIRRQTDPAGQSALTAYRVLRRVGRFPWCCCSPTLGEPTSCAFTWPPLAAPWLETGCTAWRIGP